MPDPYTAPQADAAAPLSPRFEARVPPGDDRERRVCAHCDFVDYVNPKLVAGSVAVAEDGRILLCKRAIAPRKGYWTLPAGFMEEGESVEEAALREAREEAHAELELGPLLAVYSVPRLSQVQVMFEAKLRNTPVAGPESEEVALVEWQDIPWRQLAFPTVVWALTQWSERAASGQVVPFGNPPGTDRVTRATPAEIAGS